MLHTKLHNIIITKTLSILFLTVLLEYIKLLSFIGCRVTSITPSKCNKFLCCMSPIILNDVPELRNLISPSVYCVLNHKSEWYNVNHVSPFCLSDHEKSKNLVGIVNYIMC